MVQDCEEEGVQDREERPLNLMGGSEWSLRIINVEPKQKISLPCVIPTGQVRRGALAS